MYARSEGASLRLIPFDRNSPQPPAAAAVAAAGQKRGHTSNNIKRHRSLPIALPTVSESDTSEEGEEEIVQYLPVRTRKRTGGKRQQAALSDTKRHRRARRQVTNTVCKAGASRASSETDAGCTDGDFSDASQPRITQTRTKKKASKTTKKEKRVKLSALEAKE